MFPGLPVHCLSRVYLLLRDRGERTSHIAAAVHVDAVILTVACLDAQVPDGRTDHLGILYSQVSDEHLPRRAIVQIHRPRHQVLNRRRVERRRAAGDDCESRQRSGEAVGLDVMGSEAGDLCAGRFNRAGVQLVDGRRRDVRKLDSSVLYIGCADGRVLNVAVGNGGLLDLKLPTEP